MDKIIGLPEWKKAYAKLEVAVNYTRSTGKRLLVALIHLEQLHRINRVEDIDVGTQILEAIGIRLKKDGINASVVCLIGSNVYMVAVEVGERQIDCLRTIEAIRHAVELPAVVKESGAHINSFMGVSLFPQDGRTSEQLINRAEMAMQHSKQLEGNRVSFYSPADTEHINREAILEASIKEALYERQFHLSYQPLYQIDNGRLRGFEALLRWKHAELGNVAPSEFIPIAEQNGLIVPLGEWVLQESCRMLANMNKYGLTELTISINISYKQLLDGAFTNKVNHILEETKLKPSHLELEMTEQVMLHSPETTIKVMNELRASGVRIMLDDFGAESSSLTHLKDYPVDGLKISKVIIKKIECPSAERNIAEAIIGLGHKLGLDIIAVGVEYEEQFELLRDWGCDFVQGLLLGMAQQPDVLDPSFIRQSAKTV
ncbi:MAG: putative bifunctional diguanylate cyclase/phosphodiesterase [Candidatus Pristimantibacillus sp.]